jgi:hypothetical protein
VNKSEQNCFPNFSAFLKTDLFLNIPSIDEQLFFDLFFPGEKVEKTMEAQHAIALLVPYQQGNNDGSTRGHMKSCKCTLGRDMDSTNDPWQG